MVPFKSAWIECFLPCIMACFASLADDIGDFRLKIFLAQVVIVLKNLDLLSSCDSSQAVIDFSALEHFIDH